MSVISEDETSSNNSTDEISKVTIQSLFFVIEMHIKNLLIQLSAECKPKQNRDWASTALLSHDLIYITG